ncbi:MAG: M28 family peptidase [Pseudomonadota bacterium]|nr:M28 family peptidase [Pseudomonadota bacterium]
MIESNRGLLIAAGGIALSLAATLLAYRTPAALGPDAPPAVFSASRAQAILKDLVGDDVPHPMGSAANSKVRELVVKRLTALGYTVELQAGLACSTFATCGNPTNIIATYGGDIVGGDAVLLAAHYDSVAAGPGASDDGVGVAALLEIARILTVTPTRRHPVVLLVTDGEEAGLLGAQLFTREHRLAKKIIAAVNMDARGVSGPSLMFETGTANAWLMRLYARAVREPVTNSFTYLVYKTLPNSTDFTIFKSASYQGFNLAFIGDVAHYHTPLDTWSNASTSTIQHQGDNALGALNSLADAPDLPQIAQESKPKDSVFFDVFAHRVIIWPMILVFPASLVAFIVLLGAAVLLCRRGRLNAKSLGFGVLAGLVNMTMSGILSLCVMLLLRSAGRLPPVGAPSWIAHPQALHMGFTALSVLSAAATAAWFVKRAGFWGFWFGSSLILALLALATSALVPAASYLLVMTAVTAALASLPALRYIAQGHEPSLVATDFAVLAPGLVMFTTLLPLLLLLYAALGAIAWPITSVALAMNACFFVPLLTNATSGARRIVASLAALAAFLAISVTLLLPSYSPEWPQRINIEYWFDADQGESHWWAQAAAGHLPDAMTRGGKFERTARSRFEGTAAMGFFADAPRLPLAAPELQQISATLGPRSHFDVLVRSARGAPTAFVVFPASADIQTINVSTPAGPLLVKLRKLRSGATIFLIAALPAEGMQFGIDTAAVSMSVRVFDQSYGLPEELPDGKNLQRARPRNATSSQDGDVTVVQRTVRFDLAAGR